MDIRLKNKKDFNEVFSSGKKAYSKNLTLIYKKKNELKVGICVSKKHGNAVKRNRIKRLIRASYYPYLSKIKGYYIVFLPKTDKEFTYKELFSDINYLLKKEKIINEESFN